MPDNDRLLQAQNWLFETPDQVAEAQNRITEVQNWLPKAFATPGGLKSKDAKFRLTEAQKTTSKGQSSTPRDPKTTLQCAKLIRRCSKFDLRDPQNPFQGTQNRLPGGNYTHKILKSSIMVWAVEEFSDISRWIRDILYFKYGPQHRLLSWLKVF